MLIRNDDLLMGYFFQKYCSRYFVRHSSYRAILLVTLPQLADLLCVPASVICFGHFVDCCVVTNRCTLSANYVGCFHLVIVLTVEAACLVHSFTSTLHCLYLRQRACC